MRGPAGRGPWRYAIIATAAFAVAWLYLVPALSLPQGFQPWKRVLDLSSWDVIGRLEPGWTTRRDARLPTIGDAAVAHRADLLLDCLPSPGGLLKLKVNLPQPEQRLTLSMNGVQVATLRATRPGQSERFLLPIHEPFHEGVNRLTFENSLQEFPIIVEKVSWGNVRAFDVAGRWIIAADASLPGPAGRIGVEALAGGIGGILLGMGSVALASRAAIPVAFLKAGFTVVFIGVLSLIGLVVASAATPYTVLLAPSAVLAVWGITWGTAVGVPWVAAAFWQALQQPSPMSPATGKVWTSRAVPAALLGIVAAGVWWRLGYYYLHQRSVSLMAVGTGHDADVFLNIALAAAHVEPFPWGLLQPAALASLHGLWNSSLVLALFLGSVLKLWGFYPGLIYWTWGMAIFGGLACLVPYAWQRQWGFPGIGGIAIGFALALSPLFQREFARTMTDHLGFLLLAAALLLIGRLITRARWGEAVIVGVWLALIALSRSALLLLMPSLVLGMGWAWWRAEISRPRSWRLAAFGLTVAIGVGCYLLVDRAILSKASGTESYASYIFEVMSTWASRHGTFAHGMGSALQPSLAQLLENLRAEHPAWVFGMPVALAVGLWGTIGPRTRWSSPASLVFLTWCGYIALLMGNIDEPRYLMPWLLMEGLLLAQAIDLVWIALRRWASRTVSTTQPTALLDSICSLSAVILLSIGIAAGFDAWWLGQKLWKGQVEQRQYLQWARTQLPGNAVILAGPQTDPWHVARQTQRPVIGPVSAVHSAPLVVDPARLRRHPRESIRWGPSVNAESPFVRRVVDSYRDVGHTLWVLDVSVDPETAVQMVDTWPGRLGHQLSGFYELQLVSVSPMGKRLYEIVPAKRTRQLE